MSRKLVSKFQGEKSNRYVEFESLNGLPKAIFNQVFLRKNIKEFGVFLPYVSVLEYRYDTYYTNFGKDLKTIMMVDKSLYSLK